MLACGRTDPRGEANGSFLATVRSRQNLRPSSVLRHFGVRLSVATSPFLIGRLKQFLVFRLQAGLLAVISQFAFTKLPVC